VAIAISSAAASTVITAKPRRLPHLPSSSPS
jgi:hypothetical protein